MRASLLLMRDRAMATKQFCSEEAWTILDHVERLASLYAFRSMDLDDLTALRRILVSLVAASSGLEGIFGAQPSLGGTNARG